MNIKFKIPMFEQKHGGKMMRELLLSTLATSFSIILTFGTAAWIDNKQKAKNRQQTAMMVICDIYAFKCELQWYQDEYFTKWKNNIEEILTLSRDSIMRLSDEERQKYWEALGAPLTLSRDKTAENIFTNDISTWREVNNFRFIRVVGQCYSNIADIEKNIKVKMDERGGNNKYFETNFDIENMSDGEQLIAYMEQKDVNRCARDICKGFCPYIQSCIDRLEKNIEECMKIMNISNEELNEFIVNSQ